MTTISSAASASIIAPEVERVYHQSNLVGDWKGVWAKNHGQIEVKVLNIRGTDAQIEYTHDGHTERGTGQVDGATITYGNIIIGTKDGKTAALEFSAGGAPPQTAVLAKVPATTTDQSQQLVGMWSGSSSINGQSATFQVVSVNGRDAQVKLVVGNGNLQTGSATVSKNTIMFSGKAQFTATDSQNGKLVVQIGSKSYAMPVTKRNAAGTTTTSTGSTGSSVNRLA